jgi:hypothetical protein
MFSALDWLRGRTDEQLTVLFAARPDLLIPAPGDLPALARRLESTAAARRAIEQLDRFGLTVLTAVTLLAEGRRVTTADDLAEFLGGPASVEQIRAQVDRLTDIALVGDDDGLRPTPGAREALGPYPGGFGPPGDLAAAHLATALGRLDDAERAVLTRLTPGPPLGQVDPQSPTAAVVDGLVEGGLLTRLDRYTVRIPREVALALRGRQPLGPVEPHPPATVGRSPGVATVDGTAAGQALAAHSSLSAMLGAFGTGRITALKSGGIGIVALRRIAKDLGIGIELTAVQVEILAAAGLIATAPTRTGDAASWVPTQAADTFLSGVEPAGWAWATTTWLQMRRDPSRVGSKDPAGKVNNVLAPELSWRAAPAERHRVLRELAALAPGDAVDRDALAARLGYRAPLRTPAAIRLVVDAVLDEATALGLVAFDAISTAGREVLLDDPEAASAALQRALPMPVHQVVIQADLTVVAPGRLEPALAQALSAAADVESAGGATVYRVTADSLRRAFDAGAAREDLHRLFEDHSATAVPQALGYLIDDVARRHGVLRAGRAAAYLRSEDPALITAAIGAASAAGVALRRLAPTVAISDAELPPLLEALRRAGLVPAAEDAYGSLLDLRPAPRRTRITLPTRTAWHEPAAPSGDQIAALVRRLRASDAAESGDQTSGQVLAALRDAAGSRTPLWISYADAEGSTTRRMVEPIVVSGGSVLAYDRLRRSVRTFAVHRISSAHPDGTADTSDGDTAGPPETDPGPSVGN